jgi:hypothetical protein
MKVPPFGKPLKALLQEGHLPNNSVYLYIGDLAWKKGENSVISRPTRTLILPPKSSPLDYEWPVNGCDILMIATSNFSQEYIESFAQLLFSYGAIKVTFISTDMLSFIFKRNF